MTLVEILSNGLSTQTTYNSKNNLVHVTATDTLLTSNSGSIILLDSAATAVTLSLPAPSAGLNFVFVVTNSSLANAITIHSNAANVKGVLYSADGTKYTTQLITGSTNLIVGTGAKAGDKIELLSDGTSYFASGFTDVHDVITLS